MIKYVNIFLLLILIGCDTRFQSEIEYHISPETIAVTSDNKIKSQLDFSPDGKKLAFVYHGKNTELIEYYLNMKFRNYESKFFDMILDNTNTWAISSAGDKLAYCSYDNKNLTILSFANRTEIIVSPPVSHFFTLYIEWSPDGKYLALANDFDSSLWIVSSDGLLQRQILKNEEGGIIYFSWSPDGSKIVYENIPRAFNENHSLWVVDIHHSNIQRLTPETISASAPTWFPNDFITFNINEKLYKISALGGSISRFLPAIDYCTRLKWNYDGSLVAGYYSKKGYVEGVCVIDTNGYKEIVINSGESNFQWHPFRNTLIVTDKKNDKSLICTTELKDNGIIPVTHGGTEQGDKSPIWDKDSKNILFIRDNSLWKLWSTGDEEYLFSFSPNIVYNFDLLYSNNKVIYDNGQDIYIQSFDSSYFSNLTKHINENLRYPTLSPDNKKVACCATYGLRIFSIENNKLIEQYRIPGNFSNPEWSNAIPDFGSHIAVEGSEGIYVISPQNWQPKLVIPEGKDPCWSPDGTKIAYVKGREIYVTRVFHKLVNGE